MKLMKKLSALIVASAALLSLSACGTDGTAKSGAEVIKQAERDYGITMMSCTASSPQLLNLGAWEWKKYGSGSTGLADDSVADSQFYKCKFVKDSKVSEGVMHVDTDGSVDAIIIGDKKAMPKAKSSEVYSDKCGVKQKTSK